MKSNYYTKTELESLGYLTGFVESDPVFAVSIAAGILASDISHWNSVYDRVQDNSGKLLYFFTNSGEYYTKSDIDAKGYLTQYTETDPEWNAVKNNYYTKTAIDTK